MTPDIKAHAKHLNDSHFLAIWNEKGQYKIQARLGRTSPEEKQRLLNDGLIVLWEYEDWTFMARPADTNSPPIPPAS